MSVTETDNGQTDCLRGEECFAGTIMRICYKKDFNRITFLCQRNIIGECLCRSFISILSTNDLDIRIIVSKFKEIY